MPCWESPKPSWYPLVSARSWVGTVEFPGTGCGFLVHLPAWVEGFSQAGGAELSVSLCAELLLIPSLLFLAQQPRAIGFSVFFFPFSKFQIFSLFHLLFQDAACTIRL